MKRILLILVIAILLIFFIYACGDTSSDDSSSSSDTESEEDTNTTDNTSESDTETSEVNILIYSDDNISVSYVGVASDGLNFSVENNLDSEIYLAFSSISIDYVSYDIMSSDYYNSLIVSPNSTGTGTQIMPEGFSTDISMLSGALLYGSDDSEDTYGYFVDIDVTADGEVNISMEASGTYVYGDDYVEVYYNSCDTEGLSFMIVNHTDSELALTFSTLALDETSYDIMNSDCYESIFVAPQGYGTKIQLLPDEFSTDFYEISGELLYDVGSDGEITGEYSFSEIYVD